jgi:hypothetical protein
MTQVVDIINRALQQIGTRTTVTAGELAANSTNEAIQVNLVYENIRDDLLRMAPWNFATKTINMTYITSAQGTPENISPPTTLWMPGQPTPPWGYEYQYPADCLRALWVIPSTQTGFAGGIPITTAVTGGAASFWQGPPVKFKIQNDQFYPVIAAAVAFGGTGYAVGDLVTLATLPNTEPPIGAPLQVLVSAVSGSVVTAVTIISAVIDANPPLGGSYFQRQPNPQSQGSTSGSGTGLTLNLTYGPRMSQRVLLTNQEFATLTYMEQVTDPNLMDTLFQSTWSQVIGATVCMALTGDKKLANMLIQLANRSIETARVPDGNEGLSVNDVTPDWLRIRGIDFATPYSGPFSGFDWGGLFPIFG